MLLTNQPIKPVALKGEKPQNKLKRGKGVLHMVFGVIIEKIEDFNDTVFEEDTKSDYSLIITILVVLFSLVLLSL